MRSSWWDEQEMKAVLSFAGELDFESLTLLKERSRPLHWQAGQIILDEGMVCQQIAWVRQGSIRVYKLSPDGREVTLYRIARGGTCLLSAACIINERAFPAVAEAETDTDLISLDGKSFQALLTISPALQRYILGHSLERLSSVMDVIDRMAFTRRSTAVAGFLLKKYRELQYPDITITHQQMATELGTAREVVSRTLKELENQGIVVLKRGRIRVLDVEELTRSVSDG